MPGQIVSFDHMVTNTGETTDTIIITAEDLVGQPATISPTQTGPLGPGMSQPVSVSYTAPSSIQGGALYNLTVTARSDSDTDVTDTVLDTVTLAIAETTLQAAAGDQLVSLGWDEVAGASNYEIESSENGGPWTLLATGILPAADRFYHTTNISNGATYEYQLRINGPSGVIGYSNKAVSIPNVISPIERTTQNCTVVQPNVILPGTSTCADVLREVDGSRFVGSDAGLAILTQGAEIVIDYNDIERAGIIDGPGYDFAFFGRPVSAPENGAEVRFAEIQLSENGQDWASIPIVYNWDGANGGRRK